MLKFSKIPNLIEEGFRLKKQSEQLMALAKRAVEKVIDESEKVAGEFINLELEKLDIKYPN